jgi:hypothetical protein
MWTSVSPWVKGHIAEMARCLEDPDPRVASVARLLFTVGRCSLIL